MSTFSTEDKEVSFAFNVIKDFFNEIDMYEAVRDTEHLIRSAASMKVYKKRIPGDLLYFKYKFEELIAAAFTISANFSKREEAQLDFDRDNSIPDISRHEDFVSGLRNLPQWAAFPRSLTHWQYFNPYIAVKKFTSHMTELEWKRALKIIVDYALTDCPVEQEYRAGKLMNIRLRMLQLIEACHLLHVRTNLKKEAAEKEILKPKKKK
ncbi:MAG: hypothetical protein WDM90_24415 [Ferruginibacter sp.]